MVQTMGKTGTDFHDALTGAASRELGNVQGTLEGTREMLSERNIQFSRMHEAFARIVTQAEKSTTTAEKLQQASTSLVLPFKHDAYLQQYRSVFEEYKGFFDTLEGRLAQTMDTIHKGLPSYASAIENNFREVVKTMNVTLPHIAGTFNGQVAELESMLLRGVERLSARTR